MKKLLLIITLFTICTSIFSQNIKIDVDSTYITVGEWTTFTVTATGDFENIKYSEPKNLTMTQIGKSTYYTNIQGKKVKSYILKYRVQALEEGTLKLPVFYTENKNGDKVSSEEITLYVTKLEESLISKHDIDSTFESPHVKLYVEIPDRNLFVGEAIPVKVVAYFSTRYQPGIERAPYIKTGSFILDTSEKYNNNLPEVVIQGEKWLQISWESYLTPLKSGELEIEIAMESYIEKPTSNSGFFSTSEREQIKTSTELQKITIKPLPLDNRPESFTGAIGEFSINSTLDLQEIKVGDPLTLSMDIFGSGNFQRISVPIITENSDDWKLYPESFSFSGSNGSNYKGVKTFQQILSSKKSNITALPSFGFSYFDPVKEQYIELFTEKYPLKVSPGEFQEKDIEEVTDIRFSEPKEIMRHLRKNNSSNYNRIINNPYFIITISLSLILLIISGILILMLKNKENKLGNSNKRNKLILKDIKREEDDGEYYKALMLYRDLIRYNISIKTQIKELSITSSDVDNLKLKEVFIILDDLNYSNKTLTNEEYINLTKDVLKELKC